MNKQNPIKEMNELLKGCGEEIYQGTYNPNEICGLGMFCSKCQATIETTKKKNKQFAEVLGEEIIELDELVSEKENKECWICSTTRTLIKRRISHLKQLKKEYEESLK